MSDIKISGPWAWLDPIMSDPTHPMNSQVVKLGLLTRIELFGDVFKATIFSSGRDAFLSEYTVDSALALDAAGVSFEGYPCWITCDDITANVPSDWPQSSNVDEDGNSTPKTFAQWCADQNHDVYTDANGSFAGNFQKHGWDFLVDVSADAGFGVIDESVAKSRIEALAPAE